jgi:hypothetical protein
VLAWCVTSGALQCSVQHVLFNGSEAFPHDGTAVSTDVTRRRAGPAAAFDSATSETFVFWVEEGSSPSSKGLYGQKLDVTGSRVWGNDGVVVVPLGPAQVGQVTTFTTHNGASVFWTSEPDAGQARLLGAGVGRSGDLTLAPFDVASTPSGKSGLVAAESTKDFWLLAWSDDRSDGGDILVQNVHPDGSLGPAPR